MSSVAWPAGRLRNNSVVIPFITIWFAPIAATIAALIIGLPSLRLRGPYVVLLTLAFAELVRNFATQGPKWIAGGGYGLRDVPKFGFEDDVGHEHRAGGLLLRRACSCS